MNNKKQKQKRAKILVKHQLTFVKFKNAVRHSCQNPVTIQHPNVPQS